jgi:hypothetical protein
MEQPFSGDGNRMADNSDNFSADSRSGSIQVETMEQTIRMEAMKQTIRMEAMGKIGGRQSAGSNRE